MKKKGQDEKKETREAKTRQIIVITTDTMRSIHQITFEKNEMRRKGETR